MVSHDENDFIKELKFCIQEKDIIKSRSLFQYFSRMSPKIQLSALKTIDAAKDKGFVFDLIANLMHESIQVDHAKSKLITLLKKYAPHHVATLNQHIKGDSFENKRYFVSTAYDLKLKGTVPALIEMLNRETDHDLLQMTLETLATLKDPTAVDPIADFIYYDDDILKSVATEALGEIGGELAIKRLQAASYSSKCDQLILDTLDRLRNSSGIDQLITHFKSENLSLRHQAIDQLAEIGSEDLTILIGQLSSPDIPVVLGVLEALGKIKNAGSLTPVLMLLDQNPDPSIKIAIYEILDGILQPEDSVDIIDGIEDSIEPVRMATAKVLDQAISEELISAIRLRIDKGGPRSRAIISAIINAQADHLFKILLASDSFTQGAADYLTQLMHPQIRSHFLDILKASGNGLLARSIERDASQTKAQRPLLIYVVDHSELMRDYYLNKLYRLGHNPVVFEDSQSLLTAIKSNPPDVLLLDTDLHGLDGIQIIKQIRERHDAAALPVIASLGFCGRFGENNPPPLFHDSLLAAGADQVLFRYSDEKALDATIDQALKNVDQQDPHGITRLLRLLDSPDQEDWHAAVRGLKAVGPKVCPALITHLEQNAEEKVTVGIYDVLGVTGHQSFLPDMVEHAFDRGVSDTVQLAFYEAIGNLLDVESALAVFLGLVSPYEIIRIATAQALDKVATSEIIPTLREYTDKGGLKARNVVAAIIDARADKIFELLLISDSFTQTASDYLSHDAHPLTRSHFVKILRVCGNNSLARTIERDAPPIDLEKRATAFAVDGSVVMQKYYLKKLFQLGFNPLIYENAKVAIEALHEVTPKILFSAYNFNDISGLQFINKVRTINPASNLTILMVAPISNIDKPFGVDKLLTKPFSDKTFKDFIKRALKK